MKKRSKKRMLVVIIGVLLLDLINRYVWRDNTEVRDVNHPEFDKQHIAEDDIRKQIFACLDNQVIHVTYYGKERIEDILPLLAQKMIAYQEQMAQVLFVYPIKKGPKLCFFDGLRRSSLLKTSGWLLDLGCIFGIAASYRIVSLHLPSD